MSPTFQVFETLAKQDPDIFAVVLDELHRQQEGIELIASENFASQAVMDTMGSVLTNKYAEGLPAKRYYGGCDVVDRAESLAIERLKHLFPGCVHANVQPHSGAQANMAAFIAAGLKPGDTILGMNLSHGGHLTHGSPVNVSGFWFQAHHYGVDPETGCLDMEAVRQKALDVKPKMIICGASAYPRVIDFAVFRAIADEVGAVVLADISHISGLVVTGHHPSPFPHCQFVTSTTHKTLRGPRGGVVMVSEEAYAKAIDKAVFPGTQGGPLMHVIASKAVAFKEAASSSFKAYSQAVIENAQAMAQTLLEQGVSVLSGGTDNHLMILDLRSLGITGKEAQARLESIHITTNKNTIPDDPQSPFVTSGVRLGTPAITSRGFGVEATRSLSGLIAQALKATPEAFETQQESLKQQVHQLANQYPLYPELEAYLQTLTPELVSVS
ncbi:MAG: serine hydroxymethyltransferase [Vampirovibrionales bacterium]